MTETDKKDIKDALEFLLDAVSKEQADDKPIEVDNFTDNLLNMGFTKGYLKAIDDFSEAISRKFLGVHPDELHTPFYPYEIVKIIKEIEEKMKKGEK